MLHPASVPVWAWRKVMSVGAARQIRRFARHQVPGVVRALDLPYADDAEPEHLLDVLRPERAADPRPVYIYFHGGGWTSGDKAAVDRYCATQAAAGFVVVNANYGSSAERTATTCGG